MGGCPGLGRFSSRAKAFAFALVSNEAWDSTHKHRHSQDERSVLDACRIRVSHFGVSNECSRACM